MFFAPAVLLRCAALRPASFLGGLKNTSLQVQPSVKSFQRAYSAGHQADESFSDFNERYAQFFDGVQDSFELQRGLNNCFAYDLVPAAPTVGAALRAARRVDDLPTAIRIFEGLKEKVENKSQYMAYLEDLKDLRMELGIPTKEELYSNST